MKEYIERAAILKSLGYDEKRRADVLPGSTFDIVLKEAAADVAEVRHGRWVNTKKEVEQICKCSECGYPISYFWSRTPYCPNCGARMDKEASHEVSE